MAENCYHCGDICDIEIHFDEKTFCCNGCKTVYEIFSTNNLISYYELQNAPGITPKVPNGKFDYLENGEIVRKLISFDYCDTQMVTLSVPIMHCSSCIWVLENLKKLNPEVISSQVDFPKKTVQILYNTNESSLKEIVELMSRIGYEPVISLEDFDKKQKRKDRSLIYELGVAGFAFGNVMFLSFPEYFQEQEFWLEKYKHTFRWLMFAFSVPALFYSGRHYFVSAFKGLRAKLLNIDIPIALGITVLFIRSTIEVAFDLGSGFFDSLTGLIFFLLLGKFFQQKTYSYLSFERDYRSYFPIGVTRINRRSGSEENVQVYDIKEGDRLLIRNEELIPVDGILINGSGSIDYSFVTGESKPVSKASGDTVFAGGKQVEGAIEIDVLNTMENSRLVKLWGNEAFNKDQTTNFQNITDSISKRFTVVVLSIALLATIFWLGYNTDKALNVFTAVLIIACPCAIALAAPFTLGNLLRILGKKKYYLKNTNVIEKMTTIDTIIFDKTGTITSNNKSVIHYDGVPLNEDEESLLKTTLRASNHPLSRQLYNFLETQDIVTLDEYHEYVGKGIEGTHDGTTLKIGSSQFAGNQTGNAENTTVNISANEVFKGKYIFQNNYREGITQMFKELSKSYNILILSGDNDSERKRLEQLLPAGTAMYFNQDPQNKLEFVERLQQEGKKVMMIGDGLNDAGALAKSDVGIAVSEDINVFTPASDGILDANKLKTLPKFLKSSKQAISIIKWSFILSLLYNITGLYFAVTGNLEPIIAAILMPLSSISVVFFTTLFTNHIGRKIQMIQAEFKD